MFVVCENPSCTQPVAVTVNAIDTYCRISELGREFRITVRCPDCRLRFEVVTDTAGFGMVGVMLENAGPSLADQVTVDRRFREIVVAERAL